MQITSNKFGRKIRLNKSEKDRIEQIALFCSELGRYDDEANDCSRLLRKLHARYAVVKTPETAPLFDTETEVAEESTLDVRA